MIDNSIHDGPVPREVLVCSRDCPLFLLTGTKFQDGLAAGNILLQSIKIVQKQGCSDSTEQVFSVEKERSLAKDALSDARCDRIYGFKYIGEVGMTLF